MTSWRVYFWEAESNPHKIALFNAVRTSDLFDGAVYVADRPLNDARLKQGWIDDPHVDAIFAPSEAEIDRMVRDAPYNAIHIFSGLRRVSCIEIGLEAAIRHGRAFGILHEPRVFEGVSGYARLLESWLTEHRIRRHARFVLAVGRHGPHWFQIAGYARDRIYPFAYFLPPPPAGARQFGERPRVVFLGRLERLKGAHLFIEAMDLLQSDVEVRIAGHGSLEVDARANCDGHPDRHYYGVLPMDQTPAFIRDADLLVLPSITKDDGWGAVISEALMAGVAVAASNRTGASYCLKDGRGVEIDNLSSQGVASAIDYAVKSDMISARMRAIRSEWALRHLTADAGAVYLSRILDNALNDAPRPKSYLEAQSPYVQRARLRISVIYHMFPHYRQPVLTELSVNGRHSYQFWGSISEMDGVKPFVGDATLPVEPLSLKVRGRHWLLRGYWPAVLDRKTNALVVFGNPNMPASWLIALAGRALGKKVLFWSHGWLRSEPLGKRLIRNLYFRLAHKTLVYGQRAKLLAQQSGFPVDRIAVIYNSITAQQGMEQAARASGEDRPQAQFAQPSLPLVICTARLTDLCRFDLLLLAAAKLRDRKKPLNILLVGDGPERARLETMARSLDLNVVIFGPCYEEAVLARLIYHADLTVSPGKIGLTAIHSMTYGTHVITHGNLDCQMPEVEAITPGRTGAFFRQGDASDLAYTIEQWLGAARDREQVRADCQAVIAARWNPRRQRELIEAEIDSLFKHRDTP